MLGTVNSYTDTGLTNGTTYYYKITAVNAYGESGQSNERSATPATKPNAPTLNALTAGNGSVGLTWTTPGSNGSTLTGYRVYRSTSSGTETSLITLGLVNSYTDTGLTNGTTYYYKVTALNAVGESNLSNERSATPAAPAGAPGAPTLNAAGGNGSVSLNWTTPSANGSALLGYWLYRSTASGAETLLGMLGTVNSYTDTGLTNGTTYYYKITAVNAYGESALSNETSGTPVAPATTPGAPTLNSATPGNNTVSLNWSAPASNGGSAITGYRVYRSTSSGNETALTTLGVVTSYTDTAVNNGTTYYYKVTALNAVGESGLSGERSATPFAADATPPSKPANLTSPVVGTSQVALDWQDSTDNIAVTGYRIYRDGLLVATRAQTYYLDSGLAPNSSHAYQVAAVDAAGNQSLLSTALSTKTASLRGGHGNAVRRRPHARRRAEHERDRHAPPDQRDAQDRDDQLERRLEDFESSFRELRRDDHCRRLPVGERVDDRLERADGPVARRTRVVRLSNYLKAHLVAYRLLSMLRRMHARARVRSLAWHGRLAAQSVSADRRSTTLGSITWTTHR